MKIEKFKHRQLINNGMKYLFLICTLIASSMIVLIILFLLFKGIKVFLPNYEYGAISIQEFIFTPKWDPSQQAYGIGFIVIQTILSGFGALLIAVPFSILSALYIVKMAPKGIAKVLRSTIDILASIPSVVYGVFASGFIRILVQNIAILFHIHTTGNSLLAVILLLAIMIYPTITSLSMNAIASVDDDLIHGSYALGVSPIETYFTLVLRCAKSGIFAGIILGLGRVFGEATAVMMVAGNKMIGPSFSLFEPTRTLTTTILSGFKETSGFDYDIRFSIALVLMIVIICSNLFLNMMKKKVGK